MARRRARHQGTRDSYQNTAARLGVGTDNISSAGTYGYNPITRQRQMLEWMYRGSWVIGRVVDCVAEDMVSAGVDVQTDSPPDQVEGAQRELSRLHVMKSLSECISWARLYGGSVGILMVDGQEPSTPLRMETVGRGQFRGVLPIDRWYVDTTTSKPITEMGPDLGQPEFYLVGPGARAFTNVRVHHSRVIRFEGHRLPWNQSFTENHWGLSVVERLYDRLMAYDSTTTGAAQLVFKAWLRTIKVDGLRKILAAGGSAEAALNKQMDTIRALQSTEGLTLLDSADEYETQSYTFTGLDSMLIQFGQQVSGAAEIPMVRLFGQTPTGLNTTGESDVRAYYDKIRTWQERDLRSGVEKIVELTFRSLYGVAPDDINVKFNTLWQMDEKQRAEITTSVVQSVTGAYDSGLISKKTALRELRESSNVTGVFTNITDEEIDAAEDEPPPPPEIPALPGAAEQTAVGEESPVDNLIVPDFLKKRKVAGE